MLQFPLLPPVNRYSSLLTQISGLAQSLAHSSLNKELKLKVFHTQLLRSSLFSAKIEGNQFTWENLPDLSINSSEKSHLEIKNTFLALQSIKQLTPPYSFVTWQTIHKKIMNKLFSPTGKLRTETGAIFDQFGNLIYLTPEPTEMKKMSKIWFEQATYQSQIAWQNQLILVAGLHYYFEKIHPFIDGNGRTGRIILQAQLQQTSLFSNLILPLDQYFEENKTTYYQGLEKNTRLIEPFIEFFLEGISWSLLKILHDIQSIKKNELPPKELKSDLANIWRRLLPRRQEIYLLIKDHPYLSFDMIARRFPTIPKRTLSYDVNQLVKQELVLKHGQTRGVVYSVNSKS